MINRYPLFRARTRRRKSGMVVTYYFYDREREGLPDIPLGKDYDEALKKWDEIHNKRPRIAGTLEEAFSAWESDVLPTYSNAETRKGYAKGLRRLRPAFGASTWDAVRFGHLKGYLAARSAKTQANREMSLLSLVWNWARGTYHETPFPAAGMERSRWKNKESAREFEVTEDLFAAVYAEGDQVLQDAMDIATATAMRLTDVRTILLPTSDSLRLRASKTGKAADFDISVSEVLPELIARRRALKAQHLMLLSTPTGRPVSAGMLRSRWEMARGKAATKAEETGDVEFGTQIRSMFLRDMRKYASDLADDDEQASRLLQHSSVTVTRKHYRRKAPKLKAVR